MKKLIFLASIFVFALLNISVHAQVMKGSGKVRTDTRALSGYNEIIAQGVFTLILTQGNSENVKVETDDNLIELFQTRVENKKLYITMLADIRKSEGVNVYVSLKELEKITLLNEIVLKTETVVHFDELNIFSSGLSRLNVDLYAASLTIELCDGTYAYLKGYTESLSVHVHDETELNAFDLQSDFCEVLSTGLTDVMVNAQKELELVVTGGSNLYYTGDATVNERVFSSNGFIVKRKR